MDLLLIGSGLNIMKMEMYMKRFKWDSMTSRPDGEWKFYDENGKLLKTVVPDYTEQIDDIIKVINEDK